MHRRNRMANFDIMQALFDSLLIFFSYLLASFCYLIVQGKWLFLNHLWLPMIFTVIFTLCMFVTRMYDVTTFYYTNRILINAGISTLTSMMSLSMVIFMLKAEQSSRLLFAIFSVLSCFMVVTGRLLIRAARSARIGNGYTYVVFIGNSSTLEEYNRYIQKTSMKIIVKKHLTFDDEMFNDKTAFSSLLLTSSINEVILASARDDENEARTDYVLSLCREIGVTARIILEYYDLPNTNHFVSSIGPYPVITYHSVSLDRLQLFFKEIIDIFGAIFGLVILSPVMLITALCIRLESPGPVLFRQKRAGRNGKVFYMYKFRSMYQDAEERKKELMSRNKIKDGMMFKIENDPRVTRVGAFIRKTSIDELPQLFNVLKRDMSLVGTRPPTLDEVEKYSLSHWRRVSILPGITGMWQVSGRNNIEDFEDIVSLDKKYIDEWSLGLDLKIIFRTFAAVIAQKGAH